MSAIPPKSDNPSGRRPTFRGVVQTDTSGGSQRVRRWPTTRPGTPGPLERENREKFRQVQKAANYVAPEQYKFLLQQTANSPLLPRDLFTMMMFSRLYVFQVPGLGDIWPVTARTDVSDALDVLGAVEGDTLVRGPQGWIAGAGAGGGGGIGSIAFVRNETDNSATGSGTLVANMPDVVQDPKGWFDVTAQEWQFTQEGLYLFIGNMRWDRQAAFYAGIQTDGDWAVIGGADSARRTVSQAFAMILPVTDVTKRFELVARMSVSARPDLRPGFNYAMVAGPLV